MDLVAIAARGGHVVVGRADVDLVLDDGGKGHGERREDEPPRDTGDGVHGEAALAEEGVDDLVEDGDEDDDDDRVNVLQLVIGHAVQLHLARLRDEVGVELVVDDPVDRVEEEDLAGHQRTPELVHKGLVPGGLVFLPVGGLVRRPGGFHGAPVDEADPHRFEGVGHDRPSGGPCDVELLAEDEDGETEAEGEQAHQVDRPEALVFLHEDGGDETEGAEVDAPIEDHVDALKGDGGGLDDALAGLEGLDLEFGFGHLLGDEGGHVGFDASGA